MLFIASLSDIRSVFLVGKHWWLVRKRDFWRCKNIDSVPKSQTGIAIGGEECFGVS